jgi:glutathionylspermidine synthase
MNARPDWVESAERIGFSWHTAGGVPYWDETACFSFTLKEIEADIEAPTGELEHMCLAFVDRAVSSEEILARLAIPRPFWGLIQASWQRGDRNLYGRFDFAYDGSGPAKLLEYNADTPTSLYEAAVMQWMWLEALIAAGALPNGADQFNSLHEKLIEGWRGVTRGKPVTLHMAYAADSAEDEGTVEYLADVARQAGHETVLIPIDQIGLDAKGRFRDLNERAISHLFKLYPWEWMMRESFGQALAAASMQIVEPPWKAVLSNKGLLPYLWEMAPGHPNLLPAFFAADARNAELGGDVVEKPLYSREGANVRLRGAGEEATDGPYGEEGHIVQQKANLFQSSHGFAVIGSWVVASQPAGIGIREDRGAITRDTARFIPHFIAP